MALTKLNAEGIKYPLTFTGDVSGTGYDLIANV